MSDLPQSPGTQTEADFEQMSWHDCRLWKIEFEIGDFDEDDWTADLSIGLDYILGGVCGIDVEYAVTVAPAALVFHSVTDPKIAIDWGNSNHQVTIHDVIMGEIRRSPVEKQYVHLDKPYYHWTIEIVWPEGGTITFGALGYTQTLLAEPVTQAKSYFSLSERKRLLTR